jgi:hypothetical protein
LLVQFFIIDCPFTFYSPSVIPALALAGSIELFFSVARGVAPAYGLFEETNIFLWMCICSIYCVYVFVFANYGWGRENITSEDQELGGLREGGNEKKVIWKIRGAHKSHHQNRSLSINQINQTT